MGMLTTSLLRSFASGITAIVVLGFAGPAVAAAPHDHGHGGHGSGVAKPAAAPAAAAPYLLPTDPVSGQKLGSDAIAIQHEGREVRFANEANAKKFHSDPATYLKKVDAEIVRTQLPSYPLQTCVVSGEKLGGMGDPIDYVHQNRLVRFCCPGCKDEFLKDPRAHLKKIDAAVIEQQAKTYPLKACVVSNEDLGSMGKPVDVVLGTRLVQLCCNECAKELAKEPAKYLEKVPAARAAAR
jgi:YHS domain-containing protein